MKKFVLLLLAASVFAQDKKPEQKPEPKKTVSPLTTDEQLALRNAQHDFDIAQSAITQQTAVRDAAQQEIRKEIAEIYGSRKIEQKEYTICDGPQPGVCADVKKDEIALRPVK
jgi:RNA polymerase-binding transcription factor DksA